MMSTYSFSRRVFAAAVCAVVGGLATQVVVAELPKWAKLAKDANIRAD